MMNRQGRPSAPQKAHSDRPYQTATGNYGIDNKRSRLDSAAGKQIDRFLDIYRIFVSCIFTRVTPAIRIRHGHGHNVFGNFALRNIGRRNLEYRPGIPVIRKISNDEPRPTCVRSRNTQCQFVRLTTGATEH